MTTEIVNFSDLSSSQRRDVVRSIDVKLFPFNHKITVGKNQIDLEMSGTAADIRNECATRLINTTAGGFKNIQSNEYGEFDYLAIFNFDEYQFGAEVRITDWSTDKLDVVIRNVLLREGGVGTYGIDRGGYYYENNNSEVKRFYDEMYGTLFDYYENFVGTGVDDEHKASEDVYDFTDATYALLDECTEIIKEYALEMQRYKDAILSEALMDHDVEIDTYNYNLIRVVN